MYCKKCGAQLPEDSRFCPKCGAGTGENGQHKGGLFPEGIKIHNPMVAGSLIFLFVLVLLVGMRLGKTGGGQADTASPALSQEASLVGVWKCDRGEVTFTDQGHMMLGQDGVVLGGGWIEYEIVDDTTLYLSGGDIPVGMNIRYELDGDYLRLEMKGMSLMLSRDQ